MKQIPRGSDAFMANIHADRNREGNRERRIACPTPLVLHYYTADR